MVLDPVLAHRSVRLALAPGVEPGIGGLDAVRGVVGEGEADRPGRRDRQQVAVAQPVLADLGAQVVGQPPGVAGGEIGLGVEEGKRSLLAGEADAGAVGGVAHRPGQLARERPRRVAVVAQPQHDQRVAEAGEAEPDPPLRLRLARLLGQRPDRRAQHVVEHPDRHRHGRCEARVVEARVLAEGVDHETGQVDRPEAAAAMVGDRDLAAGVRRLDPFGVVEIVLRVDPVEEQHSGLGGVVGVAHDRLPELAGADRRIDPEPVAPPVGAAGDLRRAGLGLVHELEGAVGLDGLHQRVGHAHGDVEVVELARLPLGADELHDVGMVAAQHPHLRAAARSGALDGGAGLVEDVHVADRPRGGAVGAADPGAARADRREVVADAAAAAHGLGRLAQRDVDAGLAVDGLGDRIAHRLHEAVDQRDVADPGARGRVDPPARDEAVLERLEEHGLPPCRLRLDLGEGAGHPQPHRPRHLRAVELALGALGVLLAQDVDAHLLPGKRRRVAGGLPRIELVHRRLEGDRGVWTAPPKPHIL